MAAVVLAAVAGFAFLIIDVESKVGETGVIDFALVGLAALLLLGRRHRPLEITIAILCLRVAVILVSTTEFAVVLASAFALYWLARHGSRVAAYVIAAAGAVASTIAIMSKVGDDPWFSELLAELAINLLPVALGDAARNRQERVADLLGAEGDRRVQAERLRIARDLHDIVAHALTDISIQSGIAAHLLDDDNEQAKRALERINKAGKSSLEDLRSMVGVLRSTDDVPLQPTPTDPDDLSPIVEQAERSGIALTIKQTGTFPADTPDACVIAAHRIMQESLTNIARHAGRTTATIGLHHHDDHLGLAISNAASTARSGAPLDAPSTAVGIIGMRERAESLGGSLTADPSPSGGFVVEAVLPYRKAPVA